MGWIADLLKELPTAARYKSELEGMERENAQLKQKIASFESDNQNLRQEIQRRDDVIQNEKSHNKPPDKIKVDILMELLKREQTTEVLAELLNIGVETLRFHLHELKNNNMVIDNIATVGFNKFSECWFLDQKGRKFLIEK